MKYSILSACIASAIAFSANAANEVAAADDGATGESSPVELDRVNVSARKRSESVMDVPVAIATISAAKLENNVATDLAKVAELAPQVMVGRASNGTGGFLTIRGISSASADAGLDQSVAVSIDGVPLSRGRVVNSTMYDVSQVEVLYGPQALFFGKNSPAGAIAVTTADPTDSVEGSFRAGYEIEADERYFEAAVSLPISPTFRSRIAVRGSSVEGWVDNVATPVPDLVRPEYTVPGSTMGDRRPNGDGISGRLTTVWEPDETFSAKLKLTYDKQTMNGGAAFVEMYCIDGQQVPTVLGVPRPQSDCSADRRTAVASLPLEYAENWPYGNGGVPDYETSFWLGSLNIEKSLGNHSLAATTGFYAQEAVAGQNSEYAEYSQIWSTQFEDYGLFTQEIRLRSEFAGPFNYHVGLYYEKTSRDWFNSASMFHAGFNEMAQNWTTFETAAEADSTSWSGFAQVQWDINPQLELAAGLRYTRDDKEGRFWNESIGVTGSALYPLGQVLRAEFDGSNVSPEATLRWKPSSNQMAYVAYKSGYKAGGLSNGAILNASATPSSLTFDSEEAAGFEVGYKATLLDNMLRFDLTAYRFNYEGLQLATFNPTTISFAIANAAEARTQGISGTLAWLATDRLSLNASLGINDAKYTDYRNAQCYAGQSAEQGCVGGVQDLSGRALVRAPRVTASVGGDFRTYHASGWQSELSLSTSYTSSYQAQPDDHPGGMQESFFLTNAALHLISPSDKYRISAIARNLTDEYYMVAAASSPGGPATQHIGTFARPRELALQFEWRWY